MALKIINIGGVNPNYSEALKGRWGYEGKKEYFLSVVKGIGFLSSVIAPKSIELDITLPECYDFYALVVSTKSVRYVRVTNSRLHTKLAKGEQVQTNFKLKEK